VHERLVYTFDSNGFVSAVRFVDRLTEVAEQQGHHPDLCVSWGKVRVQLRTHAAAAIIGADFCPATAIDALS
jgi:4a-hydroxytetrahydrobiopterin dehydratase